MVEANSGSGRSRIVLANTPDFDLGQLRVRPRRLSVRAAGLPGRDLEPRVMQVLVALAQANEDVVSREELADSCWEGRVVGDHALNRCIHALRQLAKAIDPPPFEIETIARIGYRLARYPSGQDTVGKPPELPVEAPALGGPTATVPLPPAARLAPAGVHIAIAAGLISLLGIVLVLRWPGSDRPTPSVAIVDSRGDADSPLARALGVDLTRFAGARANEMALVESPAEADFVIRVTSRGLGAATHGDVALLDGNDGNLLWSSSVEANSRQIDNMGPQMAAKLSNVLLCAVRTSGAAANLDHGTARLYLAACELMEDHPDEHLVRLLRKVTSRAPDFAEGWAKLASIEASLHSLSLTNAEATGERDLASAARSHLVRAREIDPKLGATFVAEAELIPPYRFAQRIAVLETGIANSPDHSQLYEQLALALFRVGRTTEAIVAAERASALNPLSPGSRANLIGSLAHAGNLARARRELVDAERIWPNSPAVMNAAFGLEYRYGDAKKAEELMARGRSLVGGRAGGFGGPQIVLRARLDQSTTNVARLVRFAVFEAKGVPQAAAQRLQSLGQFGAVDEAYQVIDQPGVVKQLALSTEVIFRPSLRGFRNDKRFASVAARLGLLQYWQSSNFWPDFCSDPWLAYDCRSEARRVLGPPKAA